MIAFISGHLDLTDAEFQDYYVQAINDAIRKGDLFVVGDAKGADTMAQKYLQMFVPNGVLVYHMFDSPRNNVGNFKTLGGFHSDDERDVAMTAASDYDIAWVRPGREKSGTARNLKRREEWHRK